MILAALALAAAPCPDGLCNAPAIQPFTARLARAIGQPRAGRPLHILQIGDSHSAGDQITGAWREQLQARLGSGGRGVLAPGRPYEGYTTRGITVQMGPGWRIAPEFGRGYTDPHPPIGLAGFTAVGAFEGATMALDADPSERFDRLTVCAIAQPGAGSLTIRLGQLSETMDLGSISQRPICRSVRSAQYESHADLTASGGPVTITSWGTFADRGGGVVVSNLGVVGSQLVHFARTDEAVLAEELRAYQPDLIVLGFGTNEGFVGRFSPFEYEAVLRSQVGRLRRLAGNVPILLLGAPDALAATDRRDADMLRDNAGSGRAPLCGDGPAAPAGPPPTPPAPAATGFTATMSRIGDFLGITSAAEQGHVAPPAEGQPRVIVALPPGAVVQPLPQPSPRGLFAPPALEAVRDVQRRVAASLRLGYWDWAGRMGGRCTAARWARAQPPLMRGDFVHYTRDGGREIAQRLQSDLDKAAR